jgi:hypothetical protein
MTRWKVGFGVVCAVGLATWSPSPAHALMTSGDIDVRCSRESQFVGPETFSLEGPVIMFPSVEQFCSSDPVMKDKVRLLVFDELIVLSVRQKTSVDPSIHPYLFQKRIIVFVLVRSNAKKQRTDLN